MVDVGRSASPIVRVHDTARSAGRYERLLATAERLAEWPAAPGEAAATDCFREHDEFWIWQPGVGGVAFTAHAPSLQAYPDPDVDRRAFDYIVRRNWLPAVFHIWGRQVIHASAAARIDTGEVVVFVGPSGAGKSTLAYGLGRRPGWTHLADDTLAFSCDPSRVSGSIELHGLPNDARLRPASADHYGASSVPVPLEWPDRPLALWRLVVVRSDADQPEDVKLTPLGPAEAYVQLLGQAHAMTLRLPEHNQRLMRDYLHVTATVPVFALTYRRSFDALDAVFDAVERL